MRKTGPLILLLLAACKEQGPSPAELKAAREQVCRSASPAIDARGDQLRQVAQLATSTDLKTNDAAAARALKLQALHARDPGATTDVVWSKEPESAPLISRCQAQLQRCDGDDLEPLFKTCAAIDSVVYVRPAVHEKAAVNEAMLNKYTSGHVQGDALAFAFAADGGTPVLIGATVYDMKLRGGVDVDRDATTVERVQALNEALRRQVLEDIEARLQP
jgi:hypothetical protein